MIYLVKLLEELTFTYSVKKKIQLLVDYFQIENVKERGYALGFISGNINFKKIKKSNVLNVVRNNIDPYLFEQSYDYVGDLAETISLIWPKNNLIKETVKVSNIISDLNESNKNIEEVILFYLNKLSVKEKWIFIKLILGGLRVGVSSKIINATKDIIKTIK